jgi:hypothetical protein
MMTCKAATFPGVTAFDSRIFASDYRRAVRRGVMVGFGTISAAGMATGVVTVTAAWIMAVALGGAPHLRARPTLALQTAVLAPPAARLVSARIAGLPPSSGDSADAAPFPSAHAVKGDSERVATAAPATGDSADATPFPSAHAMKGDAERVAARDSGDAVPVRAAHPMRSAAERLVVADASADITAALPPPDRSSAATPDAMAAPRPSARPQGAKRETARAPSKPRQVADADPSSAASFNLFQKDAFSEHAKSNPPALPTLAYAAPSPPASLSDLFHRLTPQSAEPAVGTPGADGRTAIYDIAAHTVYLPDGTRLKAHSGLGSRLDDPHYVNEKGRGPTPPNVYNLALRGEPFHGVRALRLNPVGDARMFGRDGILAHTYMLGPSGQSFGCVSFKDYQAFLKAFEKGEIDRLVVVPHLDGKIAGLGSTGS